MWVPRSEEAILAALDKRELVETSSFDAKRGLPVPGKNKDLAKDVCAMTVDGGVLLYGVDGDDPTRPTGAVPFDLKGASERIDQVVQTGISESPFVEIRDLPSAREPGKGYLVVVVPASARAPHMLTLGGDNRYWGRGATGNRALTEGDVARLYERRDRWQRDFLALLDEAAAAMPFDFNEPVEKLGVITVVAAPVGSSADLVLRAAGDVAVGPFGSQEITKAAAVVDPYPDQGSLGLDRAYQSIPLGADVWRFSSSEDNAFAYQATLELHADGRLVYWHSPTLKETSTGAYRILEQSVTRAVHQLVGVAAWLYERGGYFGAIDIGVVLKGIESARGVSRLGTIAPGPPYGAPEYRRTERLSGTELRADSRAVTARLLRPLYDVISVRGYDPFGAARAA